MIDTVTFTSHHHHHHHLHHYQQQQQQQQQQYSCGLFSSPIAPTTLK